MRRVFGFKQVDENKWFINFLYGIGHQLFFVLDVIIVFYTKDKNKKLFLICSSVLSCYITFKIN